MVFDDLVDNVQPLTSLINNDGTLRFLRTSAFDATFDIAGAGGLINASPAALTLSGNNTFTGGMQVNNGTTTLAGSANAFGAIDGNIDGSGEITVQGVATLAQDTTAPFDLSHLIVNGDVRLVTDITTTGDQFYRGAVTLVPDASVATPSTITLTSQQGGVSLLGGVDAATDQVESLSVVLNDPGQVAVIGDSVGQNRRIHTLDVSAPEIWLLADIRTANAQIYRGDVKIGNNGQVGFLYQYFLDNVATPMKGRDFRNAPVGVTVDLTPDLYLRNPLYARTLVSENPSITFAGKVDDLATSTHSLLVAAISSPSTPTPSVVFDDAVSSLSPLYAINVATISNNPSVNPRRDFAGEVTINAPMGAFSDIKILADDVQLGTGAGNNPFTAASLSVYLPDDPRNSSANLFNAPLPPTNFGPPNPNQRGVPGAAPLRGSTGGSPGPNNPGTTTGSGPGPAGGVPPGLLNPNNPNSGAALAAVNATNNTGLIQAVAAGGPLNRIRGGVMNLADVQSAVDLRQDQLMTIEAEVQVGALTMSADGSEVSGQSIVDINCDLPQFENLQQCRFEGSGNQ